MINLNNKKEIEEWREYMEKAKEKGDMLWKCHEIEKTHQAPRCKKCKKPFPRLNQKTMICNSCSSYKDIEEWF